VLQAIGDKATASQKNQVWVFELESRALKAAVNKFITYSAVLYWTTLDKHELHDNGDAPFMTNAEGYLSRRQTLVLVTGGDTQCA
jgi:hypothetical protein